MIHHNLLIEKTQESINSILPITIIVALVCFLFVPIPSGLMLAFLLGAVHMIIGMGLFSVGADLSMSKIGGHIGSAMTASRKLWLILLTSFLLGTPSPWRSRTCRCWPPMCRASRTRYCC